MTGSKSMIAASVVLVASLASFSQAHYYKDVTPDNFDSLLDPEKASILVEFYAPWCGHCKSLAPEYEKLGGAFEHSKDVIIAQVNADAHPVLRDRFKVTGFPTLKWIQKGSTFENAEDVNAQRTASALLDFVNEKTGAQKKLRGAEDHVVELNPGNFDKVTNNPDQHTLVVFVEPSQVCAAALQVWKKVADLFSEEDNIVVAKVDSDKSGSIAKEQGVSVYPSFRYYGKGGTQTYDGETNLEAIISYINDKTGMDISADDGVLPSAGRIAEISEHVKSFVSAKTEEERVKFMDTCKATVETLDSKAKENYNYYSNVFSKVTEKGMEYIENEKARLASLLENADNMQRAQRRKFMKRLNVLQDFAKDVTEL